MALTCTDCGGTGISRLFYGRCWQCGGTGTLPPCRLLETHVGICTLAKMVAGRLLAVEHLRQIVEAPGAFDVTERRRLLDAVRGVDVISRNPCALCGTFHIQEKWLGSGFCSASCHALHGRGATGAGTGGSITITGGTGGVAGNGGSVTITGGTGCGLRP